MSSFRLILVSAAIICTGFASNLAASVALASQPVFRAPFKLEVRVDKDHVWTENFDAVPYVYENGVYIFPDEKFGAKLEIEKGAVVGISYLADADKADVSFDFSQELQNDKATAMLTIENHTKYTLSMHALMMVPGEKKPIETTILPLGPGLTGFESWPQALRQLLLYEIKITK